jgi:hypothetical protein
MNITEIKSKLGMETLNLNYSTDKAGVKDENWLRHWDNAQRISVSIHADTLAKIKADPTISILDLQSETKEAKQGAYTAMLIIAYKSDETL